MMSVIAMSLNEKIKKGGRWAYTRGQMYTHSGYDAHPVPIPCPYPYVVELMIPTRIYRVRDGLGARLLALHSGEGGAALPTHGSRYVHPVTSTAAPALSAGFAHPLPALTVAWALDAEKVGAGSVGIGPVGVYVGRSPAFPPLLMTGGGQASPAVTSGEMLPAPAPPVCCGVNGGVHGFAFLQAPEAVRGSLGIQPFSRPSWYDHAGDSTLPVTDELPIFHVQKNQFWRASILDRAKVLISSFVP